MPTAPTFDGVSLSVVVKRSMRVTSTTVVNSLPSRSTVNGVGPSRVRTAVTISLKFATGVSPTLTTVSPGRIPASAAGPGPVHSPISVFETCGATHTVSPTTAVVGGLRSGRPQVSAMP
jgi:hypothetical protein